jgi:hypothetical protein
MTIQNNKKNGQTNLYEPLIKVHQNAGSSTPHDDSKHKKNGQTNLYISGKPAGDAE